MFNKNIKLVLAVACLALSIWQFIEGSIGNGIMLLLLMGVFIFLYFKNEFILLAFLKLRKQDFEGARAWLNKIPNPESALVRKQQGYYNYLHGIMLSQTNLTEAEKYLKNAVRLGLSMDHDMAMTKLTLGSIAMSKNKKREGQALIAEAEKLDKHGMLSEQIKMFKQQMKRANVPNQHYGMQRGGGKRRAGRR